VKVGRREELEPRMLVNVEPFTALDKDTRTSAARLLTMRNAHGSPLASTFAKSAYGCPLHTKLPQACSPCTCIPPGTGRQPRKVLNVLSTFEIRSHEHIRNCQKK
jgi:hypothetical protein